MTQISLQQLTFDNRFIRELPADPLLDNYPRQVASACYSFVMPKPVTAPQLVCASSDLAELIGLSVSEFNSPQFTQLFSGNQLLPGMKPFAMCYGGHQFGHWAGQLGDGRAINLGEIQSPNGDHWTLQLKGAGPTPYSRTADGFAVLRSSVREFLCSEAMHYLGVPTTRALSLVLTGDQVKRDIFYNGNPQWEPGAIVCRVAPNFIRFGNLEILSARHDIPLLTELLHFILRTDYSHLIKSGETITPNTYVQWFDEVCQRTALMIAHWMRVGFVHGVMNTDNMSILGLTIDYGPYGWLEGYDPDWTPNTTDAQGRRYGFANQPHIALWNLVQLANAIYPLIEAVEPLQNCIARYRETFAAQTQHDIARKLGLNSFQSQDQSLVDELYGVLQLVETDMTIFFRLLANFDARLDEPIDTRSDSELIQVIADAYYVTPSGEAIAAMATWLRKYRERLLSDFVLHGTANAVRKTAMNTINPKYVLRNYLAQQAIDKATLGDFSEINNLLELLKNPYDEQVHLQHYFAKRPEWARTKAGCSMLSCSS